VTAERVGIRQPVVPANEMRRLGEYERPSHLSEQELLDGYAIRIEMLRDAQDAPASPYRPRTMQCPCHRGEPA